MHSTARRTVPFRIAAAALAALVLDASALAAAGPDHASGPVPGDRAVMPKYVPLFDPLARWNGVVHWKYNHSSAPATLAASKSQVVAQLQAAFDKWSAQCAVRAQYDGETDATPNFTATGQGTQPDGENVVAWGSLSPSLTAWTYDWWRGQLDGSRTLVDADTLFNAGNVTTLAELDRVATHEWGHVLGLDHSDVAGAVMAGPPLTSYNGVTVPQDDDVRGCRCLYGVPTGVTAAYACDVPRQLDFGAATVGADSGPRTITLRNSGNAPLAIVSATFGDSSFRRLDGCAPGESVPAGGSCTMRIVASPTRPGAVSGVLQVFASDGYHPIALTANGVLAAASPGAPPAATAPVAAGPAATVDVVEYYNAALDHYFVTWMPAETGKLDATPASGWVRTGLSFKAYAAPQPGASTVCRYYIPPADGNSHFYGRSDAECATVNRQHPDFVLEDMTFMYLDPPSAGACPAATRPVYRLFNDRADVNHRYTTDRGVRDRMVAQGWIAEGEGADRVVMCAPQ